MFSSACRRRWEGGGGKEEVVVRRRSDVRDRKQDVARRWEGGGGGKVEVGCKEIRKQDVARHRTCRQPKVGEGSRRCEVGKRDRVGDFR